MGTALTMREATSPPIAESVRLRFDTAERLGGPSDLIHLMVGTAGTTVDPAAGVTLPVPSLGRTEMVEVWESNRPVSRTREGGFTASTSGDHLFGAVVADSTEDLTTATERIYRRMIELARAAGRPHLVRVWNYFPRINEIDSIERYQEFCRTRFEVFESAQYDMSRDLPAASAVGSAGGALTVVFLASAYKPIYIENPRQISAFRYPEKYGPKSPSFSRGALLPDSHTLFISGTASIVGHETVHEGNLPAQLEETLRNIDIVIESAFGEGASLQSPHFESHLKVYVRHPEDQPAIAGRLEEIVPAGQILYLRADICRRDLLVEIEAFVRKI